MTKASWHKLLRESLEGWHWEGSQLVAANAQKGQLGPTSTSLVKYFFVKQVYATHNASRQVKKAIEKVLSTLKDGCWGINFGSGHTRYHSQLLNVDLAYSKQLDIHSDGRPLPFRDTSLDGCEKLQIITCGKNIS